MPVAQYIGVYIEKTIRRKPYVTTHVHELPILSRVHECPIKIVRILPFGRQLNVQDEWQRLANRYGEYEEGTTWVQEVYRSPQDMALEMQRRYTEADLDPEAALLPENLPEPDKKDILGPIVHFDADQSDQLQASATESPARPIGESDKMDVQMLRDTLSDWGARVDNRWGDDRLRSEIIDAGRAKLKDLGIEHDSFAGQNVTAESMIEAVEVMEEREASLEA